MRAARDVVADEQPAARADDPGKLMLDQAPAYIQRDAVDERVHVVEPHPIEMDPLDRIAEPDAVSPGGQPPTSQLYQSGSNFDAEGLDVYVALRTPPLD